MQTAHSCSHLLGGVCLSACWDTPPGPGHPPAWTPPRYGSRDLPTGCGPGDPPSQTCQPPPGCGPGDPPWPDPSTSPWMWAWRPPWPDPSTYPPGCGPGDPSAPGQTPQPTPLDVSLETPPPVNRILDTRFWKYYLAPTSLRAVNIQFNIFDLFTNYSLQLVGSNTSTSLLWTLALRLVPLRPRKSMASVVKTLLNMWLIIKIMGGDIVTMFQCNPFIVLPIVGLKVCGYHDKWYNQCIFCILRKLILPASLCEMRLSHQSDSSLLDI